MVLTPIRRSIALLALAALLTAACGQKNESAADHTPALVIRNVHVFDSRAAEFIAGQTLIAQGQRIAAVGSTESLDTPRGARVIDGQGKFLIPGLIDAHTHLTHVLYQAGMTGDEILPYFLANGVTSVRSAGDNVPAQSLLRRWAEQNPELSPQLFLASWLIGDAPPIHQDIGWSLTSPDEVPDFVEQMSRWGLTTLKIYANCRPAVARRVIEEGHKRGFQVTGHLSSYRVDDAIRDGIDGLEHIESVSHFLRRNSKDRHSVELDSEEATDLVKMIADSGVSVDPTLTVFWGTLFFVDVDEIVKDPDNLRMPDRLQAFWAKDREMRLSNYSSGPLEIRRKTFRKYQDLVGMLHRAGARILVGTDAPEPQVPPGYSLHKEMELLVESGLTPASALQAATLVNSQALGRQDEMGAIEAGKRADLVLLRENPLENIRNTRQIELIVNGGLVLTPAEILRRGDERNASLEQAAAVR